jgi:hypothetical protein
VAFLTKHNVTLAALLYKSFVSDAYLDFPLWSRLDGNIVNQNNHLPRELVKLCGALGIGIGMSIYDRESLTDEGMAEH